VLKAQGRRLLAIAHDAAAAAIAWLIAYALRFNLEIPDYYLANAWSSIVWVVPVQLAVFFGFGLYRGIWRYASLPDLQRIIGTVLVVAFAVAAIASMFRAGVPRSVLIIDPILLAAFMCGSRLSYRAWKERRLGGLIPGKREPVFVLGAQESAVNLIRDLARSPLWHVVGVFDDDVSKQGHQLHGVNILGRLDDLAAWAERVDAQHAIIALPEASHGVRRRAVEMCRRAGLKTLTVPSFDDLMSGRVTISQIRHIELDDLLGRDPVVLDTAGLTGWLSGRVIMVTGAGGSIGAELCRQIARYRPRRLVLLELGELALYTISEEFSNDFPGIDVVSAVGDVKDERRIARLIATHRPTVVFHAAAYKHVPLMENDNAWQAILNNVRGTQVVAQACIDHEVEKFVLISTDKAVNPANVMGASKRLAEMVCQALQRQAATRFVMVRFGNVLGSTGSVIPKFREQIAKGGPITVTHPDITRYFMSIPEAVQLVLQAGLMGKGGEIFVLDMGEPVRIAELARDMIRLSGFTEADLTIVYTGLRAGEKLYEELLSPNESTLPTPHAKLRIAQARPQDTQWLDQLNTWLSRTDIPDAASIKQELAVWVDGYKSS
jgi:FlaA1/EpsC-like NDP-sugar epimerase